MSLLPVLSRTATSLKSTLSEEKPRFHDTYLCENTVLGVGSFSIVYVCEVKSPDSKSQMGKIQKPNLAVKVFDRRIDPERYNQYLNEAKLMRSISQHENCVQMLDAFESSGCCHIVMGRCDCSLEVTFKRDLQRNSNIAEVDLAHVLSGMISGINHLHECGVVHRDLKPANVLLASRLGSKRIDKKVSLLERPAVKICDFGWAAKLSESGGRKEMCGAVPFVAPELIQKKQYSSKADIWSCGVIAYWLFFAELPCGSQGYYWQPEVGSLTKVIFEGTVHQGCRRQPSADAREFVASLLNPDPNLRPNATQALCDLDLYLGLHGESQREKAHSDQSMSDNDSTSRGPDDGTQSWNGPTDGTQSWNGYASECALGDESPTCGHDDVEPSANIVPALTRGVKDRNSLISGRGETAVRPTYGQLCA